MLENPIVNYTWTPTRRTQLEVVHAALDEAGIVIPFPQRMVQIQSDDEAVPRVLTSRS